MGEWGVRAETGWAIADMAVTITLHARCTSALSSCGGFSFGGRHGLARPMTLRGARHLEVCLPVYFRFPFHVHCYGPTTRLTAA